MFGGVLFSHEVSSPNEFPMSCRLLVSVIHPDSYATRSSYKQKYGNSFSTPKRRRKYDLELSGRSERTGIAFQRKCYRAFEEDFSDSQKKRNPRYRIFFFFFYSILFISLEIGSLIKPFKVLRKGNFYIFSLLSFSAMEIFYPFQRKKVLLNHKTDHNCSPKKSKKIW